MAGKSNVRKHENAVWITIPSTSLNKSDIRRGGYIVLHVVECECIKHAVDIRVPRVLLVVFCAIGF